MKNDTHRQIPAPNKESDAWREIALRWKSAWLGMSIGYLGLFVACFLLLVTLVTR